MPQAVHTHGDRFFIERGKIGEALNVIPVGVAEKQINLLDAPGNKSLASATDACTGIDDDRLTRGIYLETWRIAAISSGISFGHWKGASYSPEKDLHGRRGVCWLVVDGRDLRCSHVAGNVDRIS